MRSKNVKKTSDTHQCFLNLKLNKIKNDWMTINEETVKTFIHFKIGWFFVLNFFFPFSMRFISMPFRLYLTTRVHQLQAYYCYYYFHDFNFIDGKNNKLTSKIFDKNFIIILSTSFTSYFFSPLLVFHFNIPILLNN